MEPYFTSVFEEVARRVNVTPEKVAAALRAFFRIADAWGLSIEEARILLGRPSRATLFQWKAGEVKKVAHDTVHRLSCLLGIWKALQILLPVPERADAWVRKSNALFGGQSALERMLAGAVTDLADVRAVLDAARGGTV
jgi:hypothetical protein